MNSPHHSLRQRLRLFFWNRKFKNRQKKEMPKNWQRRPLRKLFRFCFFALVGFMSYLIIGAMWLRSRAPDELLFDPQALLVNDGTLLNPVTVSEVFRPKSTEEISQKLEATAGPISIGGARKSMGGHIASPGSLHIDMRSMDQVIEFRPDEKTVRVQAGISWRALQEVIDKKELAIQIMQTYANFSVGGSLSVNAHGRYRERGPIVHSVENIRLVLANGKVVDADRKKNSELFFGAIGGYGGLGVISEATLRLTENHPVQRITKVMPTSDHPEFFSSNIQKNTLATFYNADLHPPQYDTLRAVVWQKTDAELTNQERLIPRDEEYAWTARLLEASLTWPGGAKLRKHIMEPIAYASSPITTRNHEASYDVAELEPSSREDHTYVLQEYFVPVDKFTAFVPKMAAIFRKHEAEIINVSLRHAKSDPDTLLSWAPEEVFAYVVYYRQPTTEEGAEAVRRWTKEMADLLIEMQGAWYLPYQVHASRKQFLQAYPRAPELFRLKKKFDPAYRFRGALWEAYYRPRSSTASQSRTQKTNQQDSQLTLDTPRLRSHEARTYLSIPEWYLVFQPRHYAEFLRRGGSSTDYSWADALTQYYSHEKRARTLAQPYPKDTEYEEILSVIGPSTAVEYLTKSLYESTLGALFQLTGDEQGSDEARLIADAHRSYGEFILDEPWYRFSFYPWVEKIDQLDSQNRDSSLRRFERKTIFKIEFTLKALYARVLEKLTESMPPAVEEIEVEASLPKKRSIDSIKDVRVLQARDPLLKTSTLSVPRWSAFSLRMQELAEAGANFTSISGGGTIAVSLISDRDSAPPTHARLLYRQPLASAKSLHALAPESEDEAIATWDGKERQVALVPVQDLGVFLRSLHGETHRLEHLYDY